MCVCAGCTLDIHTVRSMLRTYVCTHVCMHGSCCGLRLLVYIRTIYMSVSVMQAGV